LQGEYDHYGLAKRIQARFRERLGRIETAKVTIKQRGGVIILRGQVDRRDILEDLITIALSTEGTTHVEVWDMAIGALDPAPKLQVA
jgi:osmotically-inducible protein OsmY